MIASTPVKRTGQVAAFSCLSAVSAQFGPVERQVPMGEPHPKIYRKLLAEFRTGYSCYGKAFLCLEAMTRDEYDARMEGKYKTAVLGVAGYVPVSEDDSEAPWWIVATVGGQMLMESVEAESVRDGYTGPRLDRLGNPEIYFALEREAWDVYEQLIVYAGGHLPAAVRSAMPCQPVDPASWWLSTMWYSKPPSQEDLAAPPKKLRVIWLHPFLDAAQTIERCRLTTKSPVLGPSPDPPPEPLKDDSGDKTPKEKRLIHDDGLLSSAGFTLPGRFEIRSRRRLLDRY